MKKVIGIIGSLRKDSVNRAVFNSYRELASGQFELSEGEIAAIPMFNQDIAEAPAAVTELGRQIHEADGVMFFSPEYNYSVPGVLKNALDWLSRDERTPFNHKPCAIIGASPGAAGTSRMQYHLRQIGVFLNLDFLNKPEVMIGGAFDKIQGGALTDQRTIDFLTRHAESFSQHMATARKTL